MHITFFARLSDPFSPLTLATQGLGGTESCIYYLAKALAELGHQVTVINNCGDEAGNYEGVQYCHYHPTWGLAHTIRFARQSVIDCLVIVRDFLGVILPIPAKSRFFWAHDDFSALGIYPEQPNGLRKILGIGALRFLGLLFRPINRVITGSQWQAEPFVRYMGLPPQKIFISAYGVDPDLFSVEKWTKFPYRLIYSSRPERGLELLATEIFPRVKQACPEAELHVFSYVNLADYQHLSQAGIIFHGAASKLKLAQAMMQASVWVLPQLPYDAKHSPVTFNAETFCVGAAESQCAMTVPVSSHRGALPETTLPGKTSLLVDWEFPITERFIQAFADTIITLLKDTTQREEMAQAGRHYALKRFYWPEIARHFADMLAAELGQTETVT